MDVSEGEEPSGAKEGGDVVGGLLVVGSMRSGAGQGRPRGVSVVDAQVRCESRAIERLVVCACMHGIVGL